MDIKDLDNFLEITETNLNLILSSILSNITINDTINTSLSIYTDTNIDEWIKKLPITRGGSIVIDKIIKNPINNKDNYEETVIKSIIYLNENKNKMKYLSS